MGRRRGRRKKITYDSNESRIIYGLLVGFVAFVVLSSVFLTEGLFFDFVIAYIGQANIAYGLFLACLTLWFLGIFRDRITVRFLVGALMISFAVSGILGAGSLAPTAVLEAGAYGGSFGVAIADTINNVLFGNVIVPLMSLLIFLAVPLIASVSLNKYFSFYGMIITSFWEGLKFIGSFFVNKDSGEEYEDQQEFDPIDANRDGLKMVGEFRNSLTGFGKKPAEKTDDSNKAKKANDSQIEAKKPPKPMSLKEKDIGVKIKTVEGESGATMQNELKFPEWVLPPLDLLKKGKPKKPSMAGIKRNSDIIEKTLASFNINTKVVDVLIGPSVTQYALDIALGTKVSKIANLRNDIALALATSANAVRIEAPIPGTSYVGIEVPNKDRQMVTFREVLEDEGIANGNLSVTIGKNISGDKILSDIQKMPHLLIAGATGSGKSVVTNSFIMSLLMRKTPDEVRFILVDPKQVEFSDYNGIAHLLTPVITDMDKVNNALKWAIVEMESRYTEFKNAHVRNIEGFNEKMGFTALPYVVIVIDEMADMMMTQHGAEIENSIVKLAQKARATGIHLILATQRPSVDVITGLIKANIPGRIGMSVTTQIDSRVILDQIGAEALLGKGDLLFRDPGMNRLQRIQAGFISQKEVLDVVKFIKDQTPEVEYSDEITKVQADPNAPAGAAESLNFSEDELFAQAVRIVVNAKKGSSSLIQRKLSIGYNRAARLLDELEEHGVVGAANGSKPRDVYVTDADGFLSGGA